MWLSAMQLYVIGSDPTLAGNGLPGSVPRLPKSKRFEAFLIG